MDPHFSIYGLFLLPDFISPIASRKTSENLNLYYRNRLYRHKGQIQVEYMLISKINILIGYYGFANNITSPAKTSIYRTVFFSLDQKYRHWAVSKDCTLKILTVKNQTPLNGENLSQNSRVYVCALSICFIKWNCTSSLHFIKTQKWYPKLKLHVIQNYIQLVSTKSSFSSVTFYIGPKMNFWSTPII